MSAARPPRSLAPPLFAGLAGLAALAGLMTRGPVARAGELSLTVGPPEIGTGGSNPLSIPPVDPLEYQLEYVSDHDFETTLALTPGCFFGKRSRSSNGVYVGLGGGAVFDGNGIGPGVYSSLGYSSSGWLKYNIEIKQAFGYDFSRKSVLAPYAIRMGVGFAI